MDISASGIGLDIAKNVFVAVGLNERGKQVLKKKLASCEVLAFFTNIKPVVIGIALLDAGWVLDVDTTIKPLYGKQQGAVVSYNPKKPGRPSHSYHTYLMAGLRLVLGMEVCAGDEHTGSHSLPALVELLDGLPPERKPALVRGDRGFGSDTPMRPLEERDQGYLFKLKLTKNVKRHIERLFRERGWADAGQGWEGKDGQLKLTGWEAARRVVVLRQPLQGALLMAQEDEDGQQWLGFIDADRAAGKRITGYEYAVLVTNTAHEVLSLFVRLAHPQGRREAITSRPWLMAAVGRATSHAGQTTLTLCGLHAHVEQAKSALMQVSARLQAWAKGAAEQFKTQAVWRCVCDQLKQTLAAISSPPPGLKIGYDTA